MENDNNRQLGTLYLIPNTLGNENRQVQIPSVLPQASIEQAARLQYWIVENAKTARAFLKEIHLYRPLSHSLQSLIMNEWRGEERNAKFKDQSQARDLLKPLLDGKDVGLMSEAGVPGVADPGADIILAAHALGAKVKPLIGPSSILLGLMASGLNGQRFCFHGYIPVDQNERQKKLKQLEQNSHQLQETQIWIETPYRNQAMLEACLQILKPKTKLCVAVHLSLADETIWTASIEEWKKRYPNPKASEGLLHNRPAIFLMLA